MGRINLRSLIPAILTVLFLTLCVYFAKKVEQGPWHTTAVELWEQEEWHKLRSLGENLDSIGKEDVEAFYAAMFASRQLNDPAGERRFASLLSNSRALNWKLEKEIERIHKPESFRKRMTLFRTRLVFIAALMLFGALILSWRKKDSTQLAPAVISLFGILILLL
jgi:hypothetical protein